MELICDEILGGSFEEINTLNHTVFSRKSVKISSGERPSAVFLVEAGYFKIGTRGAPGGSFWSEAGRVQNNLLESPVAVFRSAAGNEQCRERGKR